MLSCLPGDPRTLRPVASQLRTKSPVITQVEPLLFPEEAAYIVRRAEEAGFKPSATGGGKERVIDEYRTSSTAALPMKDPVVACLAKRLATMAGMPASSVEPLQVTRYTEGQQYRPHTDDPRRAPRRKRLKTIFTYLSDEGLSDGKCGGATIFTCLSDEGLRSAGRPLRAFPRTGRGLMWANYTPEGKLDGRTEHAGEPVTCAGTSKWGLNAWFLSDAPPSTPRASSAGRKALSQRAWSPRSARARKRAQKGRTH